MVGRDLGSGTRVETHVVGVVMGGVGAGRWGENWGIWWDWGMIG